MSRKGIKNVSPSLRPEMRRLYESGLNQAEVGKIFGVSQGTVARHLHAVGVVMRPTGPSPEVRARNFHNELRRPLHTKRDGVEGKTCRTCCEWRPVGEFYRDRLASDGLEGRCKRCCQGRALAYYHLHSEAIMGARKTPENRVKFREYQAGYERERRATDMNYRLRKVLRFQLWSALSGRRKCASVLVLLGCSIDELRAHLEDQFTEGMTWANYGQPGWEIDHRRPCASFDLSDPDQQRECFHYTNLQPLWGPDNWRKAARL